MTKPLEYTVFTDGGCAHNPGGRGGYGILIRHVKRKEVTELYGGFESSTNNRMEMMAVCIALEALPEKTSLTLLSDSRYVINCLKGAWARTKNLDLWQHIDAAAERKVIRPIWIKGHDGNKFNERCDELATQGMRMSNLSVDEGYIRSLTEPQEPVAQKPQLTREQAYAAAKNVMLMGVQVPQKFCVRIASGGPISEYAERHQVHEGCASSITTFASKCQISFRDYMALRTGGIDIWSKRTKQEIAACIPDANEAYTVCLKHFGTEKESTTALRWYARGLPLEHCIRKVLVDRELSKCCVG